MKVRKPAKPAREPTSKTQHPTGRYQAEPSGPIPPHHRRAERQTTSSEAQDKGRETTWQPPSEDETVAEAKRFIGRHRTLFEKLAKL